MVRDQLDYSSMHSPEDVQEAEKEVGEVGQAPIGVRGEAVIESAGTVVPTASDEPSRDVDTGPGSDPEASAQYGIETVENAIQRVQSSGTGTTTTSTTNGGGSGGGAGGGGGAGFLSGGAASLIPFPIPMGGGGGGGMIPIPMPGSGEDNGNGGSGIGLGTVAVVGAALVGAAYFLGSE